MFHSHIPVDLYVFCVDGAVIKRSYPWSDYFQRADTEAMTASLDRIQFEWNVNIENKGDC